MNTMMGAKSLPAKDEAPHKDIIQKDNRLVTLEGRFARLEELVMQLSRDAQGGVR